MKIKRENDIFIYFEIIKELETESILDVGMFLKRVGSVSRQVMNQRIPEEVRLDGVDFFPEVCFPAWNNIYNEIVMYRDFMYDYGRRQYGLGIVLGSDDLEKQAVLEDIFKRMVDCCDYLFFDSHMASSMGEKKDRKVRDIIVAEDIYYFMDNR